MAIKLTQTQRYDPEYSESKEIITFSLVGFFEDRFPDALDSKLSSLGPPSTCDEVAIICQQLGHSIAIIQTIASGRGQKAARYLAGESASVLNQPGPSKF